mgnify:CR=1 FL=1
MLEVTTVLSGIFPGAFTPLPQPADYFNGRFSDGPVWAEYLAAGLGLPNGGRASPARQARPHPLRADSSKSALPPAPPAVDFVPAIPGLSAR